MCLPLLIETLLSNHQEWGAGMFLSVVKCIYANTWIKIQCTAMLLDSMNLENCPPPPLNTPSSCKILTEYVEVVGFDQMRKADLTFLRH